MVYFGDLSPRDRFYPKVLHLDPEEIDMGMTEPRREFDIPLNPERPLPKYVPVPEREPATEPTREPIPEKEPAPGPKPEAAPEPEEEPVTAPEPAEPEKVPA